MYPPTHTHTHTVTGGSAAQFEPLSDEYEWEWAQYLGYRVGAGFHDPR